MGSLLQKQNRLNLEENERLKEYVKCAYGGMAISFDEKYSVIKKLIAENRHDEILKTKFFPETEMMKKILEEAKPARDHKILDIGCGTGILAIFLSKFAKRVFGIDSTKEMIERAKNNAAELRQRNVEFKIAEAEKLPFDENYFDAAVIQCVICLVLNKEKAISEIHRVLKSDGKAVIGDVYQRKSLPKNYRENLGLYSACIGGSVPLNDFLEMFENAGFKNFKVFDYGEIPDQWVRGWAERFRRCCRIDLEPIIKKYMGFAIISARKQ